MSAHFHADLSPACTLTRSPYGDSDLGKRIYLQRLLALGILAFTYVLICVRTRYLLFGISIRISRGLVMCYRQLSVAV